MREFRSIPTRRWIIIALSIALFRGSGQAFSPSVVVPSTSKRKGRRLYVGTIDQPVESIPELGAGNEGVVEEEIAADNAFDLIAALTTSCLLQSDLRKNAIGKPQGTQASSATNWINDAAAFRLQKALEKIRLKLPNERTGMDRDEASTWIRWMKSTPTPLLVDLSQNLRSSANMTISDHNLELVGETRTAFLSRIGCRLILLPSGASLRQPLTEPPASIIYGKLLYGGVTRYRLLISSNSQRPPRRAGERTECMGSIKDNVPVWLQYGGPSRNYDAIDMGSCAFLEVILLPQGQALASDTSDMVLRRISWQPQKIFLFEPEESERAIEGEDGKHNTALLGSLPSALSGKSRNEAFRADFTSSVGGLQPQIDAIVRRVLDGRVIRPVEIVDRKARVEQDETTAELTAVAADAEELALLGLTPVRGLLLYGPPGCGKTALAREISRALRAREPKIVSAPELLDRWVGGSERLVRSLFADAEAELAACNNDATRSALHVIVIDEIDAVFRKRSAGEDSGEATRASAVNQILAKLDGVNAIHNVLLIGMTNRRELLDEALLRPGRLEVQIEIPLPNCEGRREILRIHFDALRQRGRLSMPLCCAIEGVPNINARETSYVVSVDDFSSQQDSTSQQDTSSFKKSIRSALRRRLSRWLSAYDLAHATAGFSGADIAGLVRCAGSLALARTRKEGTGVEGLLITLDDVKQALKEVKQSQYSPRKL